MNENLRKTLLYFQPIETYWRLSNPDNHRFFKDSPIGLYPLSFKDRIAQGHYPAFDEEGIPVFPFLKGGKLVHFYTGMCSFSFGQWELYLLTGDQSHADRLLKVAGFILRTAIDIPGEAAVLLDFDDETETTGITCAMNNGEAISVLSRAFVLTKDERYKTLALKLAKALEYPYGPNGLNGHLPDGGEIWYLEGGKYILNGHIYTLFGLFELSKITSDTWVKTLFEKGLASVASSLSRFDSGYWSYYWLNKPYYVASIMYHNLHICQLEALHLITGNPHFGEFAQRFREHANSPINRAKAAFMIANAKFTRMLGRR